MTSTGADALDTDAPPPGFGSWQDAEQLRKWSFARRTPQQRLDWLVAALTVHYQAKALRELETSSKR